MKLRDLLKDVKYEFKKGDLDIIKILFLFV